MESGIDADAPLDYVEFQLFPNHDRYEASACSGCKIETIASGLLGQLVLHLPELKDLFSRGSKASFKIQHPKDLDSSQWFTKSNLTSFLHIVGSMDILNATTSIQSEISQLEEARKFHLSLYTKGTQVHSGDGATDSCNLNDNGRKLKDEAEIVPSDSSKNELLQAMELRLTALRAELVAAFNSAAGSTCSLKHISNMEKLSQHFGDIHLRNTLRKFVEASPMDHAVDLASDEKFHSKINYRNDGIRKTEGNTQVKKPSGLDTPVNYGVSPAKVAQVERQSSTESEKSSDSSEDDQPSVERSRSLIRSASPRRSASPMRRVQIGRSGSRRATALTIKSLYFPGRDKTASYRDAAANSSEEEGSEKPPKKSDSSVLRISVKDAISLFENKQKDQTSDDQKRRSTLDAFAGANKSVLRRWSAGIGDDSSESFPENVAENFVCMNSENVGVEEIPKELEGKTDLEIIHGDNAPVEAAKVDERLHIIGEITSNALSCEADALVTQREENTEKLTASAEWNRQKEAELNEMLTKMMENKPVRNRNVAPDKNRSQDVPREQRGGFYDHYKGKRDEKLRGETAEKRAEKEAQFRAMQQVLEQRKAAMGSAITNTVSRSKNSLARPQKSLKSSTQSAKKKESPKPAVAKKALSKASPPPVRKSWPSTPSPRATTGASPAKTPSGASSTGTTPTRRKSQPVPTIPQSSPKVERSLQQNKPKNVKTTQTDPRKSTKSITEKLQQPSAKNAKTSTTKVETISGKGNSKDAAKPSFYSKVTKKSSVVPLESKPFLRKGSGIGPGTGPVVAKAKVSSSPEESVKNSENLVQAHKNEVGTDTFDLVNQQSQEENLESQETCAILELETQSSCEQVCDDTVNSERVMITDDDSLTRVAAPELKTEAEEEESFISPTAWVEIEEHQDLTIPQDDSTCEISSAVNVVPLAMSSPRVRHSLSQMLLEESAEPDMVEWGNAENPPSTVYPKDAPKGLKRLLKFARKSKGDQNLTGWSSPSVFSEGEDDAEDSKAFGKKNADTLLRKAALQTSSYGQQRTLLGEGHERDSSCPERLYAQSNINKFSAQSSSNRLQDHISGAATTKATRSFFSLSAFRGSKPNETKLR